MGAEQAGSLAGDIMNGAVDKLELKKLLNPAKDLIDQTVTGVEDIEQETRQNYVLLKRLHHKTYLCQISHQFKCLTLDPLSQDRLDLDEQLFGRPSRLG